VTEIENRILAAMASLSGNTPEAVTRCAKKLVAKEKRAKPAPKPAKPAPPADNPTPGRLIGKMDGVYVPPKSVMRSGALDHQACASLHAGVSRPYTGQPLTLGVRAK
jgi:hypothetical protein